MGHKRVTISATLIERLVTAGSTIPNPQVCTGGLPVGARLVRVEDVGADPPIDNPEGVRTVGLIFEHPSWPPDREDVPIRDVNINYEEIIEL